MAFCKLGFNHNNIEKTRFNNGFQKLYGSIFKKLQPPAAIEWFPTYYCNSHCRYCGGYDRKAISEFEATIPYKEIIEIVRLTGEGGTSTWNIGGRGGEPLLYPNLIDILALIKQQGMKGILITNGLLLNDEFVKKLTDIRWDILRISLDSHVPKIHDEVRQVSGNFDKIDKALILYKRLKKEYNTPFPNIVCCPVITNKNYSYILEYMDYCIEKGVDEIQFMPLTEVHDEAKKLSLSEEQREEFIALIEKARSEKRVRHNIGFIISQYKNSNNRLQDNSYNTSYDKLYCIHLWKTMVISEDGYLSPCSMIKDKLVRITGSYLDAWNSGIMNALRGKILKGEFINAACQDCCGPLRNETLDFKQYISSKGLR
jgi:MoaA/NifB/PqqE/SkfB family radical SAM enzyme